MAAICKGTSGAIVGVQRTRGRAGSLARFVWTGWIVLAIALFSTGKTGEKLKPMWGKFSENAAFGLKVLLKMFL